MHTLLMVVHVIACLLIILTVLIQSGKGAEISASFAGSSQTVFGSGGGANFFTKLTSVLAAVFMFTSIALTLMVAREKRSVMEGLPTSQTQTAPANPTNSATPPATPPAPQSGTPSTGE